MVNLVIDKLKEDTEKLGVLKRMIDNVIYDVDTKNNKQLYIKSSEYSNGFYIQKYEPGYDECVEFIMKLSKRYEREINEKSEILSGLLEEK